MLGACDIHNKNHMVYIADVMYHMVIEYTTYISICMLYICICITLQHVAHISYVIFTIHVTQYR